MWRKECGGRAQIMPESSREVRLPGSPSAFEKPADLLHPQRGPIDAAAAASKQLQVRGSSR